jgi:hypothetical protein
MDFNLLMDLRHYLTVAHHVPGRLRIKFGMKLLGDPRAKEIMNRVGARDLPPAIRSTRVNPLGRSVVIEYDAEAVDPGRLEELLTTGDCQRFEKLANEFKDILSPNHRQGDA